MDIFIILCTSVFFLVVWFIGNFYVFKNKLPANVSFRDGLNESIHSDLSFLLKKASIGLKSMHFIGKPL